MQISGLKNGSSSARRRGRASSHMQSISARHGAASVSTASRGCDAGFASRSFPMDQRLSFCRVTASSVIQARPCVAVGRRVICRVCQSRLAQEALPSMGRGRGAGFASRSYPMEQSLSFCRFPASSVISARPGAVVGRQRISKSIGSGSIAIDGQGLRRARVSRRVAIQWASA